MIYIIEIDNEGWILQCHQFEDEESLPDGDNFHIVGAPILWNNPPSRTAKLRKVEEQVVWQESMSLSELKVEKNNEINSARLKANRSFFMFNGKQIACDELSRSDIDAVNGVVALLGAVPISQWKAVDNNYVQIPDKATWIQFYMAMVQTGQSNFDHAQSLKTSLSAATTPEEIEVIKWS